MLLSVLACKKNDDVQEEKFLDVNLSFPIKPNIGDILTVNLYYAENAGEKFYERIPDVIIQRTLSGEEVEKGLRVTFDGFKNVTYAYVSAHVDMNSDNELSDGDLATFYNDKSFKDVAEGYSSPDNVAKKYAIDMDMRKVVGVEPLRDIDGNEYQTIVIGNQEWMAENLKVTRYRNGDPIVKNLSDLDWAGTSIGAYAIYPYSGVSGINSEGHMKATFGLLYNGHAVSDERNIAPEGWKVPTDDDWKELEMFAGMTKAEADAANWRGNISYLFRSKTGWPSRYNGTDDFGFAVLPGGSRNANGTYDYINVRANFWTATPSATQPDRLLRRIFQDANLTINRSNLSKNEGYTIRCVKIRE